MPLVAKIFPLLLKDFGVSQSFIDNEFTTPVQIIVVALLVYPICLVRKLGGLRFTNFVGVSTIFYLAIVIVVQTPSFIKEYYKEESTTYWPKTIMSVPIAFSVTIFAYVCHQNIFPVKKELAFSSEVRMGKVSIFGLFHQKNIDL